MIFRRKRRRPRVSIDFGRVRWIMARRLLAAERIYKLKLHHHQHHNQQQQHGQGLNLVAIGGGTGLSTVLCGLKEHVGGTSVHHVSPAANDLSNADNALWLETLSAIVTVSDDGGSSGRLRDELNMLAPGDIRSCMVALSEDSALLSRLFQYRFPGDGELGGHSFGNLFLAAMSAVTGDFVEAVRLSSEVLASKGRIYPATLNDVRLVAELADGTELRGESVIGRSHAPIKRLRLEPEICLPLPETLTAIRTADIITIGPGSLYTSLLPNLLVARVAAAIGESNAVKIFVCNLMTQPGETDGFTTPDAHLAAVCEYAPEIEFDYVIVNNSLISAEQTARYLIEGAQQVVAENEIEHDLTNNFAVNNQWSDGRSSSSNSSSSGEHKRPRLVAVNLLENEEKVRHSPAKLARAVIGCYAHAQQPQHTSNHVASIF